MPLCPLWRKSSRSAIAGECVEARLSAGMVEVRDSKDPTGPVLRVDPLAWADFTGAIAHDRLRPA